MSSWKSRVLHGDIYDDCRLGYFSALLFSWIFDVSRQTFLFHLCSFSCRLPSVLISPIHSVLYSAEYLRHLLHLAS